jgi:hypothetical protein
MPCPFFGLYCIDITIKMPTILDYLRVSSKQGSAISGTLYVRLSYVVLHLNFKLYV